MAVASAHAQIRINQAEQAFGMVTDDGNIDPAIALDNRLHHARDQ